MDLKGLTKTEVEESRKKHGSNNLTQIPPDPLWKKILEGFKDPMIMILLVALVVQVVLFFLKQAEWFEPVGILIAILIANGVASVSENKQEGKASALKAEEEAKEMAKVVRNGVLEEIHVSEVVVGDIVYLQAGDKIPADGIIVQGSIKVDQAALNGETEEVEVVLAFEFKDNKKEYVVYTKNEKDENGNVTVYVSNVDRSEGEPRLMGVESEEEWARIKDVLRELSKPETE